VLAQRRKTALGEVDLIARKGRALSFIEVKARATASDLELAIDRRRLSRVAAAAELLLAEYDEGIDSVQIDVLLLAPGEEPVHLANVWHEGMQT
jgi:putative endonuclease